MERAPEDAALGALGFAGICRETLRIIRSRPPGSRDLCGMVITLSLCLLAHVAVSRVLFSHAVLAASGAGFVRLADNWAPFVLAEAAHLSVILFTSLLSVATSVLSVAPCCFGFAADARSVLHLVPRSRAKYFVSLFRGDSRVAARLVRTRPGADARLAATFIDGFLLLVVYTALFGAAAVLMHLRLPLAPLLLPGGVAYLAGTAHIRAVWRVACVMSVLEDGARGFRAMHASDELLTGAGKFWAAVAVFTTLDGCAVALQLAFGALVVDNRMGLGVWLRVVMGTVMAAALWTAVVSGLVAQVVVYFFCKNSDSATKSPTDVGRKGRAPRSQKRQ